MAGKLLLVHGGGPTAVLNCSLYGAAEEAIASGKSMRSTGPLAVWEDC